MNGLDAVILGATVGLVFAVGTGFFELWVIIFIALMIAFQIFHPFSDRSVGVG